MPKKTQKRSDFNRLELKVALARRDDPAWKIAALAGLTARKLSSFARGSALPTDADVRALERVLDLPTGALIGGAS